MGLPVNFFCFFYPKFKRKANSPPYPPRLGKIAKENFVQTFFWGANWKKIKTGMGIPNRFLNWPPPLLKKRGKISPKKVKI